MASIITTSARITVIWDITAGFSDILGVPLRFDNFAPEDIIEPAEYDIAVGQRTAEGNGTIIAYQPALVEVTIHLAGNSPSAAIMDGIASACEELKVAAIGTLTVDAPDQNRTSIYEDCFLKGVTGIGQAKNSGIQPRAYVFNANPPKIISA